MQVPAGVSVGDPEMERAWGEVVARMRDRSRSLQALLRSGYLLKVESGEVTVGFLHSFHRDQFTDPKKRRVLEEVLQEVLGSSYRVECVHATKDQIEAYRGAGAVEEDDGFIEEVAERLRQYHARQINHGNS
jgi:DNA polymerase-3 subunit gamma/tau